MPVRFLRGFSLTVLVVLLLADLLVGLVGLGVRASALSPGFVLATLDRVGFYEVARTAILSSVAPPSGLISEAEAKAMAAAIGEAVSPALLREQVQVVVPKLLEMVKAPPAKPQLFLDLTKFREAFGAAVEKEAKKLGAPSWQVASIKAGLKAEVPDRLDLLGSTGLSRAELVEAAKYHRYFSQGLLIAGALVVLLSLAIFLATGRRAWGPWLGVPFVAGGAAVTAAATVAWRLALPFLADTKKIALPLPNVSPKAVVGLLQGTATSVYQRFLLISLACVVVGTALWVLGAVMAGRTGQQAGRQAISGVLPPPGAPPGSTGGPAR